MITPKELLEKARKPFFKIVASQLKGETVFPWIIPSNKNISGSNYSDWKNDLVPLHQQSKEAKGVGYSIDWKQKLINGSKQSIPARIYFETFGDYLHFIGKKNDFRKINEALTIILREFPVLKNWSERNPELLLENHLVWEDLMKVCKYLAGYPPPHPIFVRELPVPVHSKFIEDHVRILKEILDKILPSDWVRTEEKDFALRYGFRKPNIHTQIRVLDDKLKPILGYEECSLPLDDAAWLQWTPNKVFIIENLVCYLTFPKVQDAVAIFGEGFKSRLSKHIPWLKQTSLYCWFDLDSDGFEMLNMIREYYPNVLGFAMDEKTFNRFEAFAVENKKRKKLLPNLNPGEVSLYEFLITNSKRLEQERISQAYILDLLSDISTNKED
ncbi:MAG: Wadjet anti-phage system protein JetD domain-containing protein [Chitinophagaceae bacterium]